MKGDITPYVDPRTLLFSGYGDTYLKINDQHYFSGVLLHRGELTAPWGPGRLRDLRPEHLDFLMEHPPEVLLLGTGRITAFPAESVLEKLASWHIGFECMDSRAAARTYNILATEGRIVSAALLAPNARD